MSLQPVRHGWRRHLLLLLAFAVCAGVASFALYARHAAHHMPDVEAANEIAAAGGWYQRDSIAPILAGLAQEWVMPYGPVIYVWYRTPVTDAKMAPLANLGHLEQLTVTAPPPNEVPPPVGPAAPSDPAAWRWLAHLHALEDLSIHDTDMRDDDLVHLYNLPRLRRVFLAHNPNLTEAGVDRLRRAQPGARIIDR